MLIRLTEPALVAGAFRPAGELWEVPDDEAAALIEDGRAVPVSRDVIEYETR